MLNELKILIVEDEAIIALDLAMMVEDHGAVVDGPYGSVDKAKAHAGDIDVAILDVDLTGETVFPVADKLSEAGVPFLFHTGRKDCDILRRKYDGAPVLQKPALEEEIVGTIRHLMAA